MLISVLKLWCCGASDQTMLNFQTENGILEQAWLTEAALVLLLDAAFYMRETSQLGEKFTLKSTSPKH